MRINVKHRARVQYLRWYNDGWHHWAFRGADETLSVSGKYKNSVANNSLLLGDDNLTKRQLLAISGLLKAKYIQLLTGDGWKACSMQNETFNFGKSSTLGANVQFTITLGARVGQYTPLYEVPIYPTPETVFIATWSITSYVCENL